MMKDKTFGQLFLAVMLSAEIHIVSIFYSSNRDVFFVPFSIESGEMIIKWPVFNRVSGIMVSIIDCGSIDPCSIHGSPIALLLFPFHSFFIPFHSHPPLLRFLS
jgi:hypothetical protein